MIKTLPVPPHFNDESFETLYWPNYAELAELALEWRQQHDIPTIGRDKTKTALLGIDVMNTFCLQRGELYVMGAEEDSKRLGRFIYTYLHRLHRLIMTLDTHTGFQIFHPLFWVDVNGNHPSGGTQIKPDDVRNKTWQVNPNVVFNLGSTFQGVSVAILNQYAQHYVDTLADGGQYPLTVWPFHSMLGGPGHALVGGIDEAVFFHMVARQSQPHHEIKGGHPLTEEYSALGAEVTTAPDGMAITEQENTAFIKMLLAYDRLIIAGQAASHCVAWTITHLVQNLTQDLARKVYILRDCTSPVIIPNVRDYTDEAEAAFEMFTDANMNVVESTTPMDQWPV